MKRKEKRKFVGMGNGAVITGDEGWRWRKVKSGYMVMDGDVTWSGEPPTQRTDDAL